MSRETILKGLNPQQQEAVETTEGPLLVVAGAGSGKTSVLTRRIAYLVEEKGVAPWNILAITFTNKAATEMKERVQKLLGPAGQDVWMSTFHALCVRILRRDADKIGYSRNFSIADSSEQVTLIKHIEKDLNINPKQYNPRAILSAISNAKNDLLNPKDFEAASGNRPFDQIVSEIYKEYQKRLGQDQIMDFDDLIMQTLVLFQKDKATLHYYQNKFRYLLVDEYQDTNEAQYQLCRLLAAQYSNVCVVGDGDQSIYGWRGANMENILNFEKDYKDKGVHTVKLEQNYRSTGHILSAANAVIKNNQNRKSKRLWTDQGSGEKITYYRAQSDVDEAIFVISKITEAVKAGKRDYKDFAILYRTNAQSRGFEESLVKSNIPYQIVGGHKFYDRKEIKDILAYLKLVANTSDSMSFNRIVNVPKRGIGAATVDKLLTFANERGIGVGDALSNLELVPVSAAASKKLADFNAKLVDCVAYAQDTSHTVTGLTEKILEDFGYTDALKKEKTLESASRLENLDEFLTVTKRFDDNFEADDDESLPINDFLSEVTLLSDQDDIEDDGNQVTLMTLHAAKGLEFPVVFLVGMEDGIFPLSRAMLEEDQLEEERRLAYVGITRAREKLYLTNAFSRTMYGKTTSNPASRFVQEIKPEDLETEYAGGVRKANTNSFTSTNSVPFFNKGERAKSQVYTAKTATKASGAIGAEKQGWNVGDQVTHKAWGKGVVVKVNGTGEDMELDIAFEAKGIKRLLAAFAPIKKV
ncbi:DNA helicase PcrA [Lactobacillus jensenii]|jgi:ATP-dependent DNA helicase pcrA|uniref:ATP-dependent DNA helicase n=2 Tax=Lactobacillus jensenii TaxID=109790 RepID=A0A5N1I9S7_LACJE|nr:DNA helicase PcrA [Lactobacillus jensenii]EEQ67704.1 ATP-dependent DNA helicase PcrA [Lactobacillus jensenii 1153]ERJ41687.1 ATP-dependent DNA helicase PcrA [Lactobacillus jensenii MD IIE-70(2)]APT15184.1 ATP-dependent DNA helicase PcrA [Lactobacillus jensenii]EEQ24319.1 ATP-dependent DNA helicase PcrA [Lactobacillus jensenii 269-3]EEX26844.1 ATP-dependent DNA helicase PcrA [Lactobacillus jensenii SJ-7A-US]